MSDNDLLDPRIDTVIISAQYFWTGGLSLLVPFGALVQKVSMPVAWVMAAIIFTGKDV